MPEDAPVEGFQKLLEALRTELGRSDPKYTAVSIDKHYLSDLLSAGEKAMEGYWALASEATKAQERIDEAEQGLEKRSLIDPKIIS